MPDGDEGLSADIQSVSLYNLKSLVFHYYAAPFAFVYSLWIGIWLKELGFSEYFEFGCIGLVLIGVLQIVCCLCCYWSTAFRCLATCKTESNVSKASYVRVEPTPNNGYSTLTKIVHTQHPETKEPMHYFMFQRLKYVFASDDACSARPVHFPLDWKIEKYSKWIGIRDAEDFRVASLVYGLNILTLSVPSFGELFLERATAPFFVFQIFCVSLWCLDEYWMYSVVTLVMLVAFEATLVMQQLKNMIHIRSMGAKPYRVLVYRERKWQHVLSDQLVPGDVISVCESTMNRLVPCDLLLMRGNCIVDESMLTGESVPVTKESIEALSHDEVFQFDSGHKTQIIYGGTKIVQHSAPEKSANHLRAPDNGCICFVLRTGLSTSQGSLLKTIMYSVKTVTSNNLETFLFILFLLAFAFAAAIHVWVEGTKDPSRNRYKLLLECTVIVTSVIPQELPIELSLAVNSSLIALSKLLIFCTEPFRIPFAGKVDICCFDKTGTLTEDAVVVEGVAGLPGEQADKLVPVKRCPLETIQVMAAAHSLLLTDTNLLGDPLEKAMLEATGWNLSRDGTVHGKTQPRTAPLKIYKRFPFSSALRRMSVIAGHQVATGVELTYYGCVKGSPEALKGMLEKPPLDYDEVYLALARQGARVIALGWKALGSLSHQRVRDTEREEVESALKFAGFVILSCPLKPDSHEVVDELIGSSHHVSMITGDNPLTACHVSRLLRITRPDASTLVFTPPNSFDADWHWQSVDDSLVLPAQSDELAQLFGQHDFCLTGDGMHFLCKDRTRAHFLRQLLPKVRVFARMAPKQKEEVLNILKSLGYVTLMCGDGTNDVGALKQAHVGVSLINSVPLRPDMDESKKQPHALASSLGEQAEARSSRTPRTPRNHRERRDELFKQAMDSMQEDEHVVRMGDASIAAPFTAKMASTVGVCHIIKQGRCTLVTTLQMFKILAINALASAYSLSVLFLKGFKPSESQIIFQALLLTACFFFISRSLPLKRLSKQRPLSNIFNAYTLLTTFAQFSIHFYVLTTLVHEAELRMPKLKAGEFVDLKAEFKPTVLNTVVYLISTAMQASTIAVNYKGHPFMKSLTENKPLFYGLLGAFAGVILLASGYESEQMQLVQLDAPLRAMFYKLMALDLLGSFVIDRLILVALGRGKVKKL